VCAGTLGAAAGLIAAQQEREAAAFELGRLAGFADGWRCGLEAGADRGTAA
jgi:hypothetical protein